ncbi:putative two-component response-regulatory protein YehT [Edwardsiella hoshinae]|uniref:Putative two-component response-regulatory protein YehT n=1 Tax=Edwardsiella hoshinae TaxID=93378 RepID=A0A376D806_9GAMM|nr:putative two-component response-regulatory protein YehT [Edwardsiella hoshinae]
MLTAIIVEDEYLAREELAYLIGRHSQIRVLAQFEDGLEAFKYLQAHRVDVVFLDIQIPAIDGMMLARNLLSQPRGEEGPAVVFVTAYKEFAAEAFELAVFNYILKPYNEARIIQVLQQLEQQACRPRLNAPESGGAAATVNLTKGERIIVTPCEQIYYAEADEKLTYVYTRDDRFVLSMSLSEFISRLPTERFFRCHRSYCVNIDKISEIVPWFNSTYLIHLHDLDFEVPVSRSNIKAFRQLMRL